MLSYSFYVWLAIISLVYLYSEFFLAILWSGILKNLKFFSIQNTKKNNVKVFKNTCFSVLNLLLIIFFFTLKFTFANVFFSFILLYIFISVFIHKYYEDYLNLLNFNFLSFFMLFFFVNNYILFYLLIEIYAIFFYFFFLKINFNFKQLHLIQYKNSLLLYLFNNFLTSIVYLVGVTFLISFYGTVNFFELIFFNTTDSKWQLYFLIISFILKLSLPGFHFLKIEIYKYLTPSNVIFFSVITLYINFLFTIFFFNQNLIFFTLNSFKFMNILMLCIVFFFIHKLKISIYQEFISYSGFATNTLILLNFLI